MGAHLSSGLDSSAVVALAAPILQESGGRVVAFTAAPRDGFAEQYTGIYRAKFDESPLAAATAAMYPNVEHVVVRSPGREPGDDLDRNVFAYQQPMRNLCSLTWLHAINDAARQRNLKVMLIGQWGNASFSYDGRELLPELLGSGQLIEWARHSATMMRAGGWRLRGVVASSLIPYLPVSLWTWLTSALFGDDRKLGDYAPLSPKYLAKMTAKAREASHDTSYKPGRRAFDHRMQMLCSHDLGNVRKGTLAGWGIDLRDPTADRRLVEFCLSVPTEQYYADGVARALARRAFKGRVPEEVLSRNFRGYQTADWHERLDAARPRLGEELDRVAANTMASRIVDVARLRTILHERPTEDWEEMRTSLKHRYVLLRGISAGHFLRKASGDNR